MDAKKEKVTEAEARAYIVAALVQEGKTAEQAEAIVAKYEQDLTAVKLNAMAKRFYAGRK